jgi:hypothetical protein
LPDLTVKNVAAPVNVPGAAEDPTPFCNVARRGRMRRAASHTAVYVRPRSCIINGIWNTGCGLDAVALFQPLSGYFYLTSEYP